MSAEATGWVYRHSPFKGAGFAVHLAIADTVSDLHGNEFWMAQANLAAKARVTARSAREAVSALIVAGMIEPVDGSNDDPEARRRAGRPVRFRFLFPDVAVIFETRAGPRNRVPTPSAPDAEVPGNDVPTPSARGSDVTQENPTGEPKGGKPRARFAEFDALVAAFGEPGTREEAAFYAKVARGLKDQGKSPADIEDRGRRARERNATCTVNVVLTRWNSLAPPSTRRAGGSFDDVARRDREART